MISILAIALSLAALQVEGRTKCELERENAGPMMPGKYIPTCDEHGEYTKVQCHPSTGYCWCVDENGQQLDGTQTRFGRPSCLGAVSRQGLSKCQQERKEAGPMMPGKFIPQCNDDGSYSKVQCHASTAYCWCVDENGKTLYGTETRFERPSCEKVLFRRELSKCQQELIKAGPMMPGKFIPQCNDDGSYAKVQCHASTGYCWCVNENGQTVYGTETRFERPSCKKADDPTPLSRCQQERNNAGEMIPGRYIPQCNEDGSYSRIQCHGSTGYCWCVDDYGQKQFGTEIRGGMPSCERDCKEKRAAALKQVQLGLLGLYVPQCLTDGSYKEVQCYGHLNLCWCVEKKTGNAIEGTHKVMVDRAQPKCRLSACELQKKRAQELKKQRPPLLGVFEPECQNDGKYAKIQCHENTCYCADQITGRPVGHLRSRINRYQLRC